MLQFLGDFVTQTPNWDIAPEPPKFTPSPLARVTTALEEAAAAVDTTSYKY